MMKKRYTILLIGILMCQLSLYAQDIHFSQFYASPLTLNPALTGVMNCNNRFTANYRNQWASILKADAYNTYSVSYDRKIPVGQYDYFGLGGALWSDVAGSLNFGTMKGLLSVSFSKRMFGDRTSSHYLVLGANGGLTQRRIDFHLARWGDQHNGDGGFDPDRTSQEDINGTFDRDNFLFADVGVGLLWFSVFDKNNNVYIGGAYDHLNRPDQSFNSQNTIPLFSKYTVHAGGEFLVANNISLLPGAVMLKQGPSFEVNAGTSLRFLLGESGQAVQFGVWSRVANQLSESLLLDAFIVSARFDYNEFSIGFSYDINTSQLNQATNANGSFEFSLIYKICGAENRGVYCPEF